MTKENISEETLSKEASRQNSKDQTGSRRSISSEKSEKSERKIGDSSSTNRRESRRLSRLSESITVISDCANAPDTCVLCGSGLPYSKCICCENEAHNRCIGAFFCTTGRRVNLDRWKCPKCVTVSNMNSESTTKITKDDSKASQVDLLLEVPGCPFCKMEKGHKNCECRDCAGCLKKNPQKHQSPQQAQCCSCEHGGKCQMLKYNKCLQYRDFSTKIDYKYLEEEDRLDEEGEAEDTIMVRICWSISWFLLFVTFAFPIAVISAAVFIIFYCFDACCSCCHPACYFFLEGIKLPGTCCRGICSGDPMCPSKDDTKFEKR